jgi:pimeloyl-ACP methyl ester carboxylesterase
MNQLLMATNDPIALAAVIRGMQNLTVSEAQLRANKVPTLALIGDQDPLKAGVDQLDGVMSNLEIVVIEGADHMTAFSRPEFKESLKKFLAAHSPAETEKILVPAGN